MLAELQSRCADIFEECNRATWDCPVEGGCSLKRPDMALDFGTQVVIVEVDELQHEEASCWDEDTRLAVIAADFQVPISVIRLRVDAPVPCFRRKRLSNGESSWIAAEGAFKLLMSRAETALREIVARHRSGSASSSASYPAQSEEVQQQWITGAEEVILCGTC